MTICNLILLVKTLNSNISNSICLKHVQNQDKIILLNFWHFCLLRVQVDEAFHQFRLVHVQYWLTSEDQNKTLFKCFLLYAFNIAPCQIHFSCHATMWKIEHILYMKHGEEFTACYLIGMCFPSPVIIWPWQAFITLSFVSPLSLQKSHPDNTESLWNSTTLACDLKRFAIQI